MVDKKDIIQDTFDSLQELRKNSRKDSPDELKNWFDSLNQDFSKIARRVPASTSYFSPGDLIIFKYSGTQWGSGDTKKYRLALITVNQTGNITYVTLRSNLVLTCFNMPFSEEVSKLLISRFYKKKNKAIYVRVQPILAKVFGSGQYRSYILNKMTDIYKINLDLDLL